MINDTRRLYAGQRTGVRQLRDWLSVVSLVFFNRFIFDTDMRENEYINMENLTSLRNVRLILGGLIDDNVLSENELSKLRLMTGKLIRKYTKKIEDNEIIIDDSED